MTQATPKSNGISKFSLPHDSDKNIARSDIASLALEKLAKL
jgi:hypothetical protein